GAPTTEDLRDESTSHALLREPVGPDHEEDDDERERLRVEAHRGAEHRADGGEELHVTSTHLTAPKADAGEDRAEDRAEERDRRVAQRHLRAVDEADGGVDADSEDDAAERED